MNEKNLVSLRLISSYLENFRGGDDKLDGYKIHALYLFGFHDNSS